MIEAFEKIPVNEIKQWKVVFFLISRTQRKFDDKKNQ